MAASKPELGAQARAARHRSRLALALVALVGLLTLVPADAAPKKADTRTQREEVRKQKVALASQLDKLNSSSAELQDALEVLDANLRVEEAALENAEAEVTRAGNEAAEIQRQQADAQARLEELEARVKDVAVEAYAKPPDDLLTIESSDLNTAVRKQALLGIVGNANLDITEEVRGLKTELDRLEDERLAALARAEQARADVQARRDQVAQAQQQQQDAVDALDARIERLLSEAQQLEAQDKALSAQLQKEAEEAAARAAKARRSGGSGGGARTIPSRDDIVSVRGIWVHKSIADRVEGLLDAADAAGVSLGGSGYRDSSAQIALRRAHCGSSNYDIYEKPAFQCRPPTARPGTSNHEQGLAIDFTSGGSVLTRSSSAFKWLQNNARRFGFYNLPSEPWHWSVDGN
jgi:LAS superfamily LD-carboxypeptidase LdcB